MTPGKATPAVLVPGLRVALAPVAAILLGVFVLFGVGFAQGLHEAAHDSRHSFSFPCH